MTSGWKLYWEKSATMISDLGFLAFLKKAFSFALRKVLSKLPPIRANKIFADALFINGCSLPHPPRYRIDHQIEQLQSYGIVSEKVNYERLSPELVKRYRIFIFFRCPVTDSVRDFISLIKKHNKKALFDIDDLVIDTKYTNQINYVKTLSQPRRRVYDQGVLDIQKTLLMCDGAIVSTERLAEELKTYLPHVFINRNTASQEMVRLSQKAIFKRDRVLSKKRSEIRSEKKRPFEGYINKSDKRKNSVKLGYFSGSITHNDDFNMILPIIARIMEEFPNVKLYIVGELDIPPELAGYKKRIVTRRFIGWKKLPKLIASVDMNLAPLTLSVFNEAKSENKWLEAALVKVPTVASSIGAMKKMIIHGETGYLCEDLEDWYSGLKSLILGESLRKEIGEKAFKYVMERCSTIYTGKGLADYLKTRMTPNIVFMVPSIKTSGGILVVFKHCAFLKKAGYDTLLLNEDREAGIENADIEFEGISVPVLSKRKTSVRGSIDNGVGTFWSTVETLIRLPNIQKRYYLVQNFETDFYEHGNPLKLYANATYALENNINYITVSKWCKKWLKTYFGLSAKYAPNGIDASKFYPLQRDFSSQKIRILIEGNSEDYYKNVDESFKITQELDPDKYEIWYMSYQGKPKPWYRVDKFLRNISHDRTPDVYRQCHILLKSSILESFSYPPLEMMATGGLVVVSPNGGNKEYLEHGYNCLLYEPGDIRSAAKAIEILTEDVPLRETLYRGGIETAEKRDWKNAENSVISLYGYNVLYEENN